MPSVFVVQDIPYRDLSSARSYGDIVVLVPAGEQATVSGVTIIHHLRKLQQFTDNDYLLLCGDPVAIGAAVALAADMNDGKVRVLKWDRRKAVYLPITLDFNY